MLVNEFGVLNVEVDDVMFFFVILLLKCECYVSFCFFYIVGKCYFGFDDFDYGIFYISLMKYDDIVV